MNKSIGAFLTNIKIELKQTNAETVFNRAYFRIYTQRMRVDIMAGISE